MTEGKGLEASMTLWVAMMAVVFFVAFASFILFAHASSQGIQNFLGGSNQRQQNARFQVEIAKEADARDTSNLPHYILNVMRNQGLTQARFQNAINCEVTADETVEENKWYHVAVTYSRESGRMRVYVDGTLAAIGQTSGRLTGATGSTMTIGGEIQPPDDAGDDPSVFSSFKGFLDEFRVYNKELEPGQITDLINDRSIDPAPVGYWSMDSGSGQQVTDESGSDGVFDSPDHAVRGIDNTDESHDPEWRSGSACKSGSCLHFDGNDDVVKIADGGYTDWNGLTMMGWVKPKTETVTTDYGVQYTFDSSGHIIGQAGEEDAHRLFLQSGGEFEFFLHTYDLSEFAYHDATITAPPDTCGFNSVQIRFKRAVRNLIGTRSYQLNVSYRGEEVIYLQSGDQTYDTGPAEYYTKIPMAGRTTAQLHMIVEGNDLRMRWR
ncbi:MAG: LamG domain-containing protein [Candidatus Nanohaloarchaea archaeon]|nr:LamG domain-containing protein [Candidatus Nanohaloarchaea archaeon]